LKLKVSGLSRSFGGHTVLRDVSFAVENVHSIVLIGPSGGGKTTLLRILAGLISPDAGVIEIGGERLHFHEASLVQHRRTVGIVFQSFNLFPHLTALENVTLPLRKVHGKPPDEADALALSLLKRFELQAHAHKKPAALSGGQRQRVAIVRAAAIKPRILFFDEPTSALDPEMTGEVLDMIEQLREEGSNLVLVTHEIGFARVAADRVFFLAGGQIIESGDTKAVLDQPQTAELQRFLARVLKY
jgi:polar amino acid transport system ATP-binding protein